MNHDLDHCRGVECSIREHCLRYLAHLDAVENVMSIYYNDGFSQNKDSYCYEFTGNGYIVYSNSKKNNMMQDNKLTIEEQFLTIEQYKELKELGIDFDNCNYMILNGSKKIVAKSDILGFIGDDYTPTLSVAEMMEMLPIINEERFYIQITRECEIE